MVWLHSKVVERKFFWVSVCKLCAVATRILIFKNESSWHETVMIDRIVVRSLYTVLVPIIRMWKVKCMLPDAEHWPLQSIARRFVQDNSSSCVEAVEQKLTWVTWEGIPVSAQGHKWWLHSGSG